MRTIVRLPLLLGLMCLMGLAIVGCSSKPADVVTSYEQACNKGDVGGMVSLYAEDASFQVPGLFSLKGQDVLRQRAEYDQALHLRLDIGQIKTRGDSVTCLIKETSDWLQAADIDTLEYDAVFVVRQGRIASITAGFTLKADRNFRRVFIPLMEWARVERAELLAEMMPQGEFVYNAENARKNLFLLQDWKQNVYRQGIRPGWKRIGG